jgi:hypothetical protein
MDKKLLRIDPGRFVYPKQDVLGGRAWIVDPPAIWHPPQIRRSLSLYQPRWESVGQLEKSNGRDELVANRDLIEKPANHSIFA